MVNFEGPELFDALKGDDEQSQRCQQFFLLLALCHTVVIEEVNGQRNFSASSPDELALVSAAAFFGYEFTRRENDRIFIRDVRRRDCELGLCAGATPN